MMDTLIGRHAVVTGGSRGIGLAIARTLQAQGARVTLMARDAGQAASSPFARTDAAMWQRMLDAGWGRIVNVASTAGLTGQAIAVAGGEVM